VETQVSRLIASAERGDRLAVEDLFEVLYSELHRLARAQLARNGGGATLGTTTLLHEAYLDIAQRESVSFLDRGRFMAYAAKVMRGLIIDYARHRGAQKRGAGFEITSLEEDVAGEAAGETELEHIGAAVDELAAVDPALAEIVDLKFFCGFSFAEIAGMRNVSERTVRRGWERARIYLHHSMQAPGA
jgi:RNA polymerase sigma factor (TIGR02999 family)